jgi:uncharacterized protein with HEPN domain
MFKRDDIILLQDIIEAIENIDEYTLGLTLQDFLYDRKTKDAVARNFMIVGEAIARMSSEFKSLHSEIEWKELKDFRNVLIHSYEIIDYSVVWDNIKEEMPPAYKKIKDLLNKLTTK